MKKILFALVVFSSMAVSSLLAEEVAIQKEDKIETSRGTVYVGMSEDKLGAVFQANNRLLVPHNLLHEGWLVFTYWPSGRPNDVITFYLKNGKVTGWERRYNPTPVNEGSAYQYNSDEKIDKWFFPAPSSRWDGASLSLLNWNELKKSQKVMFITEYIGGLNKQFDKNISVDVDKYIIGMDYYADHCSTNCERIMATLAVNDLLISDGKASSIKQKLIHEVPQ